MDPFVTYLLLALGVVVGWCACESKYVWLRQRKDERDQAWRDAPIRQRMRLTKNSQRAQSAGSHTPRTSA